ncbi:MAG: hypothetical protein AAF393_00210 [Pseudomonadota bacterium]
MASREQDLRAAFKQTDVAPPFWPKALIGFLASGVVMLLFVNIQTISDMAPQSIKDSDYPGLLGLPIALLSVGWIITILIWFVISLIRSKSTGVRVRPFIAGAFAGLAVWLIALRVLSGGGEA